VQAVVIQKVYRGWAVRTRARREYEQMMRQLQYFSFHTLEMKKIMIIIHYLTQTKSFSNSKKCSGNKRHVIYFTLLEE